MVRPRTGDLLARVGDSMKRALSPEMIPRGDKPIIAWAMDPTDATLRDGSRLNEVLLVRLTSGTLTPETKNRAADDVVAYTAICTHMGCEVDDFLPDEQLLHCGCHGSKFDPRDAARVMAGEAPRPLAALPLTVDGGRLVVAGAFTSRVGFDPA